MILNEIILSVPPNHGNRSPGRFITLKNAPATGQRWWSEHE